MKICAEGFDTKSNILHNRRLVPTNIESFAVSYSFGSEPIYSYTGLFA